jgi:hypothetical protein
LLFACCRLCPKFIENVIGFKREDEVIDYYSIELESIPFSDLLNFLVFFFNLEPDLL